MTRTTSTIICVAMLIASHAAAASAEKSLLGQDGCPALAAAVYGQFTGVASSGGLPGNPLRTGAAVCNRTASTVSAAFTRAMAKDSIAVSWGRPGGKGGDACEGVFLSQCYPHVAGGSPGVGPAELAYVYDTWRIAQDSIARFMPFGDFSDTTVFLPGDIAF